MSEMAEERSASGPLSGNGRSPYMYLLLFTLALVTIFAAAMLALARGHHIEILKIVAGAFVTLLATLLGASVAFAFARLQMREQMKLNELNQRAQRELELEYPRQELAFSIQREFSTADMLRARTDASRLLESKPGLSYGELYNSLPEQETRSLFLVSEFYDRLALAVQHNRIDRRLVPELFGAYFVWWWTDVFEKRFVAADPEWPESKRMRALYRWLEENSSPEEFALWSSRASAGTRPEQS